MQGKKPKVGVGNELDVSGCLTNEPSVPAQQQRLCPWLAPATPDSDGGLSHSDQLSETMCVLEMTGKRRRTGWDQSLTLKRAAK